MFKGGLGSQLEFEEKAMVDFFGKKLTQFIQVFLAQFK